MIAAKNKTPLDRGHYTETVATLWVESHGFSGSFRVSCAGDEAELSVTSDRALERDVALEFERRFKKPPTDMELLNLGIRARVALRQQQWSTALEYGHRVLQHRPSDSDALLAVGIASAADGDLVVAELSLCELLERDPQNVDALYNLAQLQRLRGQDSDALRLYELAITTAPDNHAVLYRLATLFEHVGRQAEALETYQRAVQASPQRAEPWGCAGMDFTEAARSAPQRLNQT